MWNINYRVRIAKLRTKCSRGYIVKKFYFNYRKKNGFQKPAISFFNFGGLGQAGRMGRQKKG